MNCNPSGQRKVAVFFRVLKNREINASEYRANEDVIKKYSDIGHEIRVLECTDPEDEIHFTLAYCTHCGMIVADSLGKLNGIVLEFVKGPEVQVLKKVASSRYN